MTSYPKPELVLLRGSMTYVFILLEGLGNPGASFCLTCQPGLSATSALVSQQPDHPGYTMCLRGAAKAC